MAFWSKYGRGTCGVVLAAGMAFAAGGCSSGVSRFDFPSFNLTEDSSSDADLTTTASLPVPSEPVYDSKRYHYYGDPKQSQASLTPQSAYTPRSKPRRYGAAPAPAPTAQASGPRIKVQRGDTLSSLSQRYGVSIDTIQTANNLPDARLREGQQLIIPGASAQVAAAPTPTPEPSAPPASPNAGETTYTVQAGDTPHAIAEKLGADEQAIIARNNVRPDNLQIGHKLIIPAGSAAPRVTQAESEQSGIRKVKTTAIAAPGSTEQKPTAPKNTAASDEVTGAPRTVARIDQLPNPEPMSGNSFRWPVKGRVISGFGTKPDGGHNDGINISVPQGTSVKAAENGVVAYAGNELKGYGNLVLVRHANNWVSAYANNDEILVKRGDKVRRGEVIAKAGTTGSASQPQVHFELRKGSRPVDPTKYMSSMTAEAD